MSSEPRKDFPKWMVDNVYIRQDGVCATPGCMNPLSNGFHRHHKNGDHNDNSIENLELHCAEHHFAKKAEQTKGHNPWTSHRELQEKVIGAIMATVGESEKLSGATLERVLASYEKALSESWKMMMNEIEYPSPFFDMIKNLQKTALLEEAHRQGYEKGIGDGVEIWRAKLAELSG